MGAISQVVPQTDTNVLLVIALYDRIVSSLEEASTAVEKGDVVARRSAVKRALDIIIHLQARMCIDAGNWPAQALSEFYASMFAQILCASQKASQPAFLAAIERVIEVRAAWGQLL